MQEIKKELLESIAKERSEDAELINKPDNVLTLHDALECVKQYEKHLQKEKKSISHTIKDKYYISLKNPKNLLTLQSKD